jgi:hypothetical protein
MRWSCKGSGTLASQALTARAEKAVILRVQRATRTLVAALATQASASIAAAVTANVDVTSSGVWCYPLSARRNPRPFHRRRDRALSCSAPSPNPDGRRTF